MMVVVMLLLLLLILAMLMVLLLMVRTESSGRSEIALHEGWIIEEGARLRFERIERFRQCHR